jgi:hypothetical protein
VKKNEKTRLLLIGSLLLVSQPFSGVTLNVPHYYQEQGYWCWAAVDQMVRTYYGTPVSQCGDAQLAADHGKCALDGSNCCANPASCNSGCTSQLQYSPLSYVYSLGAMSWATITSEINHGWPFIIVWDWDTGGTHMMVAKGYLSGGGINWIQTNDPIYGETFFSNGNYKAHVNSSWHAIHW